jgi:AcrR family transcriptional regulator
MIRDARENIRTSHDPRARRTRAELVDATERLLQAGTSNITVPAIVRAAGLSRSVFYTHFSGVEDLAVTILESAIDEIGSDDAALRGSGAMAAGVPVRITVARLISHMETHRDLYVAVLAPTAASFERILQAYVRQIRLTFEHVANLPDGLDLDALAHYIASGSFSVLLAWVRAPERSPSIEIEDFLIAVLPTWMSELEENPGHKPVIQKRELPNVR